MKKIKKTNVMRILDKANISYKAKSYEYEINDLSGVHAAEVLGYDPDMVFKTIVTKGDKTGPVVFCLPSEKELNLKEAAKISGNKKLEMVHVKDLFHLTGYLRGGCSPIGMKKTFPTYIDISINNHKEISISAGQRGQQIVIKSKDFLTFTSAQAANITQM